MKNKKYLKQTGKAYLYLLPSIALLAFIYIWPSIKMFYNSFVEWNGFRVTNEWNNFENYLVVFRNPDFLICLRNSLFVLVTTVPLTTLCGIFCAQFLYYNIRGTSFYRFLFFVPNVMPVVVVGIVFTYLLQNSGPLNELLRAVGLGVLAKDWFATKQTALPTICFMAIWKDLGFAMILMLGRLTQVPVSLYEAARLDGASDVQLIRHISLPMLKDTIILYMIMGVIGNLTGFFSYINVTTNGGPGFESTVLEYFIYLYNFRYFELGQGSAASVLLFVLSLILSIFYLKFMFGSEEG